MQRSDPEQQERKSRGLCRSGGFWSAEQSIALLNRKISSLKGTEFSIDPSIDCGYLIALVIRRVGMRLRGRLRFPLRCAYPYVGAGVTFRRKHLIKLGRNVSFGPDVFIDAMSVDGLLFGNSVTVGRGSRVEATGSIRCLGIGLKVGDRSSLGTDCYYGCAGGITLGSDVLIGNFVSFHSENHIVSDLDVPISEQGVARIGIEVGSGTWIGAKSTILDGANIGEGCIVAAGAVVTAGKYPAFSIIGGVPAKVMSTRQR